LILQGEMRLKRRLLQRLGWIHVRLDHVTWRQISTRTDKIELLHATLAQAGIVVHLGKRQTRTSCLD